MKAKLSILALGAMALVSSCSNDQTVDINDGNAIKFGVTVGKSSRAAVSNINALIDSENGGFKVWANDGISETNYINGALVTSTDGSKWTMDGTKFWPQGSLNFFALYPKTINPTIKGATKTFDYTVTNGETDILYAANIGLSRPATGTVPAVALNFYHALSQVVFKVKNTKSDITVVVKGIKIENINKEGTFTWGDATTDAGGYTVDADGKTKSGSWTSKTPASFPVWTGTVTPNDPTKAFDLPGNPNHFLMPQALKPWCKKEGENITWQTDGVRVLVDCEITDNATGMKLWPKAGTTSGNVAISLDGKWNPGYKYTYTIVFGQGAGYDDTNPENPDPVLVPISFSVSVDGFTDASETLDGKTN